MDNALLIIENGPREAKEEILRRVLEACSVARVRPVFIRHKRAPKGVNEWYSEYFHADDVIISDVVNLDETESAIRTHLSSSRIQGAYTYLEEAVPVTQRLARRFGCSPITNRREAAHLRNKSLMRDAIAQGDRPICQPTWTLLRSGKEFVQFQALPADRQYLIKPAELGSSLGVARVPRGCSKATFSQLLKRAQEIDFDREWLRDQYDLSSGVLIESLVERDNLIGEISVEVIVFRGRSKIFAITEKRVSDAFDETGHVTASPTASRWDGLRPAIENAIQNIVTQLDIENTALHAEFIIREGEPVFVEVGARLGGDLIPILVEAATARKFIEASVLVSLDRPPPETVDVPENLASILFLYEQDIPAIPRYRELARSAGALNVEIKRYSDAGARIGHLSCLSPNETIWRNAEKTIQSLRERAIDC